MHFAFACISAIKKQLLLASVIRVGQNCLLLNFHRLENAVLGLRFWFLVFFRGVTAAILSIVPPFWDFVSGF